MEILNSMIGNIYPAQEVVDNTHREGPEAEERATAPKAAPGTQAWADAGATARRRSL